MELILLQHLSSSAGSYEAGKVYRPADEFEAARMIEKGIAKAKNKKEQEAILEKARQKQKEREEEEARTRAILEKEALELELLALYGQVVDLEAALVGVVLSDEQKKQLVEELKNREARISDSTDK